MTDTRVLPQQAAPRTGTEGDMYVDETGQKVRIYLDGAWRDVESELCAACALLPKSPVASSGFCTKSASKIISELARRPSLPPGWSENFVESGYDTPGGFVSFDSFRNRG